jgi:hypothetical protein
MYNLQTGFSLKMPMVCRGVMVSVLATGPKVRGFKPGRGEEMFKGDKIRNTFLPEGSKAGDLTSYDITDGKRTLQV